MQVIDTYTPSFQYRTLHDALSGENKSKPSNTYFTRSLRWRGSEPLSAPAAFFPGLCERKGEEREFREREELMGMASVHLASNGRLRASPISFWKPSHVPTGSRLLHAMPLRSRFPSTSPFSSFFAWFYRFFFPLIFGCVDGSFL